jgi:hypothetical protein
MADRKNDYDEDRIRQALAEVDRDPDLVAELQKLLSTAGHVFECHGEGVWSVHGGQKDYYAGCLAEILIRYPNLPHRLLKTRNRLVKSLTYRAVDMLEEAKAKGTSVRELFRLDEPFIANPPGRDRRWK